MKILNAEQIRACDAYTIAHEPISSTDLMERAASVIFSEIIEKLDKYRAVHVFCGIGNNGGDGLVLARLLLQRQYRVQVFIVRYSSHCSADFTINLDRLNELPGSSVKDIYSLEDMPEMEPESVIIDALWGSGLNRPIQGFAADIIHRINNSGCKIFAVDMPSGTFCDSLNTDDAKIKAHCTYTFLPPKLALFIPENQDYIGEWKALDIGLDASFIENADTRYCLNTEPEIKSIILPRKPFDYKNKYGHALLVAGSYGKVGAAVLAARACLRSGVGLLSCFVPRCAYQIMQTAIPEAMVYTDQEEELISSVPDLSPFNVLGIGPGIATHKRTAFALKKLLSGNDKAFVLDADAINILALDKSLLELLPENSILTPHIGEFDRLVGPATDHFQRLEHLRKFCQKHRLIVVLKGKYTAIGLPDGSIFFNQTGNPGMATGGSGDVLTGVLTGLLARGYKAQDAAKLGVWLHGLAGDLALSDKGEESLIAGDLIEYLPKAFKNLNK